MNVNHIIRAVIQVEIVVLLQWISSTWMSRSCYSHDYWMQTGAWNVLHTAPLQWAQTMAVLFSYSVNSLGTMLTLLQAFVLFDSLLTGHHFQLLKWLSILGKETFSLTFYSNSIPTDDTWRLHKPYQECCRRRQVATFCMPLLLTSVNTWNRACQHYTCFCCRTEWTPDFACHPIGI